MDIYTCCRHGNLQELQQLISEGANVNEKNNYGNTPLHYACIHNHLEIVKELIIHNANVNEKNNNGYTALHKASQWGKLEIVKELIDYCDLSITDNYGWKAVDVAYNEEIKQFIRDYQDFPTIEEPNEN